MSINLDDIFKNQKLICSGCKINLKYEYKYKCRDCKYPFCMDCEDKYFCRSAMMGHTSIIINECIKHQNNQNKDKLCCPVCELEIIPNKLVQKYITEKYDETELLNEIKLAIANNEFEILY